MAKPVTQASFDQMQQLNLELWDRVHKMEFLLETELGKKQRDERRFQKKLVRLAKYMDMRGIFKDGQGLEELSQALIDRERSAGRGEERKEEKLILGKRQRAKKRDDPEATETDSDFEEIHQAGGKADKR